MNQLPYAKIVIKDLSHATTLLNLYCKKHVLYIYIVMIRSPRDELVFVICQNTRHSHESKGIYLYGKEGTQFSLPRYFPISQDLYCI